MSDLSKKDTDALLTEIKERFDYGLRQWQEVRDDYSENMKVAGGDPWASEDRQAREAAGRPCISTDEINQYTNQIANDLRANPRGAKFSPRGNGANDKTARLYQDKWREVEYRSNAAEVYIQAAESAIQGNMGWIRLNLEYVSERSFHKEMVLQAIPNALSVVCDPDAMKPDSSDMKWLFCFENVPRNEFARLYPGAEIRDFSDDVIGQSGGWVNEQTVRVAEYWKIETEPRELRLWQKRDGTTVEMFKDEGNVPGAKIALRREVEYPRVCQYLTNGVEILKKTPWKGKRIPFASCYGKILWIDDGAGAKRRILSAISLARDPFMAYCWVKSMELETIGTITRNPYWAYRGSLTPGQLEEVRKSLHEPVAVLQAEPVIDGVTGQLVPLPQRNPLAADISTYLMSAESWRRAIQAAMAMSFLPTEAQKQNEKSGVALEKIRETGQRGSFHFSDHLNGMIRSGAELGEDLMDKGAITASREVTVIEADGTSKTVKVVVMPEGQPTPELGEDEYSVRGDHAVTISVGPQEASEREATNALLGDLAVSKEFLTIAGPQDSRKVVAMAIRARNGGPMVDKIADILDPPSQNPGEKGENPEVARIKQQATQMLQEADQKIQEQEKIIEADQIKAQADMAKAQLQGQIDIEKAKLAEATKLQIAQMQLTGKVEDRDKQVEGAIVIQQMKDQIEQLKLQVEAIEAEKDRRFELMKAQHEARKEAALAEQAHEHEGEMAEYGARTAAAQGERSHEQNLEAQERASEAATE